MLTIAVAGASVTLTKVMGKGSKFTAELPADAVAGLATLRLGRSDEDRLDSVAELVIDLGALERVPEIELEETRWAQ